MQRFMQTHPDGYLADRLKGDWLVAATRAGNYALAARLGPVVNSNSQETCSLLLAQHMTGQRGKTTQAIEAFKPNSACWTMLDEFQRSEEHTSAIQSLMRISYAVFCLKKKKRKNC